MQTGNKSVYEKVQTDRVAGRLLLPALLQGVRLSNICFSHLTLTIRPIFHELHLEDISFPLFSSCSLISRVESVHFLLSCLTPLSPNRYTRLENLAWSHSVFWQLIFCRKCRFMKPLLFSIFDTFNSLNPKYKLSFKPDTPPPPLNCPSTSSHVILSC